MEIKGFLETSFVDWREKICAVLFLPSCNLRCPFCHNHELVLHPEQLSTFPWDYIRQRLTALRSWLDGVCITGGEPTLHPDLPELLFWIQGLGLAVKLDTNGTRPEMLEFLISKNLIDYLAMDIKGPLDQETYGRCAGVRISIPEIKRSMDFILSARVAGEFRTTIVPQWHTPPVLARMALELAKAPKWTHQEFNPSLALDPALRSERPGL
jgi:anaerobic ribonucleoside-triphosphate reductase activating protein